jgi:hypothetical protein
VILRRYPRGDAASPYSILLATFLAKPPPQRCDNLINPLPIVSRFAIIAAILSLASASGMFAISLSLLPQRISQLWLTRTPNT